MGAVDGVDDRRVEDAGADEDRNDRPRDRNARSGVGGDPRLRRRRCMLRWLWCCMWCGWDDRGSAAGRKNRSTPGDARPYELICG